MKKEPIIVNVYLWGTCIGKLNWDFESIVLYSNLRMSIGNKIMIYVLSTHPKRTLCLRLSMGIKINYIKGFRNFLQMRFLTMGASLFDQWLTDNNIKVTESLPLLKLSYIGKRAMGALEFEPEFNDDAIHESVNMSSLATLASKYIMIEMLLSYHRRIASR